jgi:DNA helicase-2/ATP-dependent DNA helicase PcrA
MLRSLNESQARAVTHGDGPLLVLAGAGSGKTRVLTARVAYLLNEKAVPPGGILAVTFTNKAAGEMRSRLRGLVGEPAMSLWLGTFHSLGLRILRKEARAAGLKPELSVFDEDDQMALIRQVMGELSMNDKAFRPKAVLSRISQAKNDLAGPDEFRAGAGDFFSEAVAKVYSLYQKRLREMNSVDFGDLISEPVRLLREHPGLLAAYRERLGYVLVDEYQDTNRAQYVLTGLLASGTRNILAVGDPDQSIYAWRGADVRNILEFQADYPDAAVIRLEQNYRSTGNILSAANSVIRRNRRRMEKTLWTENPAGASPRYEEAPDEYAEAELVVRKVKETARGNRGVSYGDMAVFYRTNAQSRVFEERLIREAVPYTVVGGVKFYDRREVKDALAYLRVTANPDDSVALRRVINTPPRGVGAATFERVAALAASGGITLYEAFREALVKGLLERTRVSGFIAACDSFRGGLGGLPLHELALRLLEDAGYMLMLQGEGGEESVERTENVFELISAIRDFEASAAAGGVSPLSEFLSHVALVADVDGYEEKAERLTLMTIHSAKGLEFKAVFMVGMEEGLFPHSRSMDDVSKLEEERRLCYVGMTRAREELHLSSSRTRTMYGEKRPQERSRFIDEISPGLLKFAGTAPGRGGVAAWPRAGNDAVRGGDSRVGEMRGDETQGGGEPYYTADDSQDVRAVDAGPGPAARGWRVGMKVMHPSFGVGVIKQRTGGGENELLLVSFKGCGTKNLSVRYAKLEPLS